MSVSQSESGAVNCKDFVLLGFDVDGIILMDSTDGSPKPVANWKMDIRHSTATNTLKTTVSGDDGRFTFANMSQVRTFNPESKALNPETIAP